MRHCLLHHLLYIGTNIDLGIVVSSSSHNKQLSKFPFTYNSTLKIQTRTELRREAAAYYRTAVTALRSLLEYIKSVQRPGSTEQGRQHYPITRPEWKISLGRGAVDTRAISFFKSIAAYNIMRLTRGRRRWPGRGQWGAWGTPRSRTVQKKQAKVSTDRKVSGPDKDVQPARRRCA